MSGLATPASQEAQPPGKALPLLEYYFSRLYGKAGVSHFIGMNSPVGNPNTVKQIVKPGCLPEVLAAVLSSIASVNDILVIMSAPAYCGP
ncbi:unnamed protein product [Sphagnum compactum]